MINWTVRLKNPEFWKGMLGALGTAAVAVCGLLGLTVDVDAWVSAALAVVTAVFAVLNLLGVVVDPTTQGVPDSARALAYTEPRPLAAAEEG